MKTGHRLILKTLVQIAIIVLLHAILLHSLAKKQVVAAILAAGDHVSPVWIGLAISFVIVRFVALVLLPGFVLQRLMKVGFYLLVERQCEALEKLGQPEAHTATTSVKQ